MRTSRNAYSLAYLEGGKVLEKENEDMSYLGRVNQDLDADALQQFMKDITVNIRGAEEPAVSQAKRGR